MKCDVAVVGLGAFGSTALWRLAERGIDVVGIEQFRVGHALGSSHGATRLFRVACLEHPGLVPLAQESETLWRALETASGAEVLDQTGGLMAGPETGRAIAGTRIAAERNGLAVDELGIDEIRSRFPQHAGFPDHYVGLWDPGAGIVRPEVAVESSVRVARARGARILDGVRVSGIEPDGGGMRITTATGAVEADQVVVATGPWLSHLVPSLSTRVLRSPLLWYRARDDDRAFELDRFPVFIRHYDEERTMWGHGATAGEPAKLGLSQDDLRREVDPDTIDRSVDAAVDWARFAEIVAAVVPGLDPVPVKARPCMITNTGDGQFVLGRLPDAGRVVVAGGCSGHGFKHASGVGEAVARQITGEDPFTDLDFLSPARFA